MNFEKLKIIMVEKTIEIQNKIFEHISKNSHHDIKNINSETLLFKEGIFDSMGFVTLIDFIEEQLGVKSDDEDLIEENFESIEAITRFVLKKGNNVM